MPTSSRDNDDDEAAGRGGGRYYFTHDFKNARKGPPNRAINFYYASGMGSRVEREGKTSVVNYSMRKQVAGETKYILSRGSPLRTNFPDPFNFSPPPPSPQFSLTFLLLPPLLLLLVLLVLLVLLLLGRLLRFDQR